MEAIIAAQVAAATIYDMCKAVQKDMVIRDVRLVHKSGGRTGTFERRESLRGADLIMLAYPNISPVALSLGPRRSTGTGLCICSPFWPDGGWRVGARPVPRGLRRAGMGRRSTIC